jgi:hypothetical protein
MYWDICTLCYFVRYKCISVTGDYREVLIFFLSQSSLWWVMDYFYRGSMAGHELAAQGVKVRNAWRRTFIPSYVLKA